MNKKMKPKIVMVGRCPRCGAEVTRKYPIDLGVCTCKNPDVVEVPLKPVVELSNRQYRFFERVANFAGLTVEELVNCYLIEAASEKLRILQQVPQSLPELVLTVSSRRRLKQRRR